MIEGVGHVDLSVLSPSDKQDFLRPLRCGLRDAEEAGSSVFGEPTFYPGFIDCFRGLIDMLSSDLNEWEENIIDSGEI